MRRESTSVLTSERKELSGKTLPQRLVDGIRHFLQRRRETIVVLPKTARKRFSRQSQCSVLASQLTRRPSVENHVLIMN